METKADEPGTTASKRPRDNSNPVVESPEKKARSNNDSPHERQGKTNPVIVPANVPSLATSQPVVHSSSVASLTIHIEDEDIGNIMGSPPRRLIVNSQELKVPPSPASPSLVPNKYIVDLKGQETPEEFESSTKETSIPTVTKPGKARASCFLFILPLLLLYWVATVKLGFWIAEKLDHELDAFGYRSSLRKVESKVKALLIEQEHVVSNWKQKLVVADPKRRG